MKTVSRNKIFFWGRFFWTMAALLIIPMILYVSATEWISTNDFFGITIGVCIAISLIMSIVFRFGMAYNAYKMKKYGWMLSCLILGDIFFTIFYFAVFKKEVDE